MSNNRRSESRKIRMSKVAVLSPTQNGKIHREAAFMEDVNRTGCGLRARFPLPIGFPLLLEVSGEHIYAGTVRHCNRDGVEYLIGVEFDGPADDLCLGRLQNAAGFGNRVSFSAFR